MNFQLTFRDMQPSAPVASRIRAEAAELERYFDQVIDCHVVVEAPHRHHRHGWPLRLRIILNVPQREIVVEHTPSLHAALTRMDTAKWVKHLEVGEECKEVDVAIREAFGSARRRLEDYSRCLHRRKKLHLVNSPGRTEKLMPIK